MRYDWNAFRPALRRAVFRLAVVVLIFGGSVTLFHPKSPLPDQWHPLTPLDVKAPLSGLTNWKLRAALSDDAVCHVVLERSGASLVRMDPLEESDVCHIRPRITLKGIGGISLKSMETRCQTALRLAMWERHGLQAAARRHLGQHISEIAHFSSYSCREIRTPDGSAGRMSTHATANAIDISGFATDSGNKIDLRQNWQGDTAYARFLRDAFQSACLWFPVALGPDYNDLHADHFHLQTRGWGLCR